MVVSDLYVGCEGAHAPGLYRSVSARFYDSIGLYAGSRISLQTVPHHYVGLAAPAHCSGKAAARSAGLKQRMS